MNIDDFNKRVKEVNQQREAYIKSPNYIHDMVNITLQNLNLKSNDIPPSDGANAQTELMSMYCQVIDLYPEVFGEESKNLKQSIINSIYAYADMDLFKEQLSHLINNNPTSFLIIPTTIWGYYEEVEKKYCEHAISTIISKEDGAYKVTTIDKAGHAVQHIESKQLDEYMYPHVDEDYLIEDYTYYLKENDENILLLGESLFHKNVVLSENNKEVIYLNNLENENLIKLEKAAFKQSYGEIKGKGQTYGNCYVKELMSGLKYATLPIEKNEKDVYAKVGSKGLSTQKINTAFSYIMMYHLESLGCSERVSNHLSDGITEYNNFKNLKSKDLDRNPEGFYENIGVFIKQQKDLINNLLDFTYKFNIFNKEKGKNIENLAIHYGLGEKENIALYQSKINLSEVSFLYREEVKENIETLVNEKASIKTIISKVQKQNKLNEIIRNQHKPTMICEKESTIQTR